MGIDSHEIERARAEIIESVSKMRAGTLSYIEGSRDILALVPHARLGGTSAFLPFEGIASETDHFPLGEVRLLWNADALAKMQPDWEHMEQWAHRIGEPACQAVIDLIENSHNS